jgi:hypothetical protein
MGKNRRTVEIRVDVYTRSCLTVIAVLLTVLIVALWAQPLTPAGADQAVAATPPTPGAGIPDAGRQRDVMIKEMENQTSKLEALIRLFESGKAKVQVVENGKAAGKSGEQPPADK